MISRRSIAALGASVCLAGCAQNGRWDIIVVGLFTAVFAFAAGGVVRALCRRFPKDTGVAALVAVFVTSIAVSAAGVMMGELWSDALEILRIGNAHLSYRVSRIPWPQHRLALFLAGVGIIWLLSAWRYRMEKDA